MTQVKKTCYLLSELTPRYKVYVNPLQVSYSLHYTKIKEGLRVAVLDAGALRNREYDQLPEPRFNSGVVEKIWGNPDNPIVTIKFDDKSKIVSISFGLKENSGIILKEFKQASWYKPRMCNLGYDHSQHKMYYE